VDENWRTTLEQALTTGDRAALKRVRKTDLHCHGLLSAPIETYARFAEQPLPPVPPTFGSFEAFGMYIATNLLPILAGGRDVVEAVIRDTFDRFIEDGVVYAEPSFDLLLPEFIRMSVAEFAELLSAEAARVADRVTIAPEIGIDRGLPADLLMLRLKDFLATGAFRSLDLYADEQLGAIDDFVPLYRLAREHGLKLKAHAGELCGPERVRESVTKLNLHAVQHGVRAAEDPQLVDHLAERGTLLHICPTSNYSLGVCDVFENHPARRLFDNGVKLTVNSDDYALFGAGVSEELLSLSRMGFSANEIAQIVENGLAEQPAR
jgi:adenosine deaminase